MMANRWQGDFPWQNLRSDGFERTSPVERFPSNRFGLYDMAGNVWEWTSDDFAQARGNGPPAVRRSGRKIPPSGSHAR